MKRAVLILLMLSLSGIAVGLWRSFSPPKDAELIEMLAERERESYEAVSQSDDPLIRALFTGEIKSGTPIEVVTAVHTPVSTESYGPYEVYQFDEGRFSSRRLVTYKSRVVSASAGSCTWGWEFFDNVPQAHARSMSVIDQLRRVLKQPRSVEIEEKLKGLLEEQLRLLD